MRYQIQTTPIWDAFKSECECPLCAIEKSVTTRLVSFYLGDAVMSPEFRIRVNKSGFCTKHFKLLYDDANKLGLALQLQTRTAHIEKSLTEPKDAKSAKRLAQKIRGENTTCIICAEIDDMMHRYAFTVAQMYSAEPEFCDVFKKSAGFCLPHYALLLENAAKAGAKLKEYLTILSAVMGGSVQKISDETERFIMMFDYNSTEKHFKGSETVVKRAINKLKGDII